MDLATRLGANATGLAGSPLTRRRLLSVITVTAALGAVPALADQSCTDAPLTATDARLVALADAMEAIDQEAEAHITRHSGRETTASDLELDNITRRYSSLEEDMAALPADTLAGVLAKARAAQLPALRFADCPFALSIDDDVWRLFGGAVA